MDQNGTSPLNKVFGSDDRYYASQSSYSDGTFRLGAPDLEKTLTDTILRRYPDLDKRVERAYRRWNLTIRDILRTETGLRLSIGENHQAVQVRVVDGLSYPFQRIFQESPDPAQWDLALHLPLLSGTQSGLTYLKPRLGSLLNLLDKTSNPARELEIISDLVNELVQKTRQFNLLQAILSIDEDTLGAYFFHRSTVYLYWLPIGIVANLLDVSIEALTVVILAHELAHAYTHLGLDIDGKSWFTHHFAGSDAKIVEGFAQFYASVVCRKIHNDYPSARDAFDLLLNHQPSVYWTFAEWTEDVETAGELVRHCLIRARSQGIGDYPSFLHEIENGKELFKFDASRNFRQ